MFLTVAIPVYNVELYIGDCLDSILNQTEKDFEILLVDDGSYDNSPIICDTYAKNFSNVIRVIHKEHSGSLLTRRVCLKNAQGQFIYLMDSDDKLVDIDAFKKLRNVIETTHCDMVIFEMTKDEITKEPFIKLPFNHMEVFEDSKRKLIYELFVTGNSMNSLCTKVFSRKLIDYEADYSIYNYLICGTDVFQVIPIVSNANKIVIVKDAYYYYRTINNSLSKSFNINTLNSFKTVSLRLEEYLKKWGILDQIVINHLLHIKIIQCCINAICRIQYSERTINNRKKCIDYLQNIAEDDYFNNNIKYINEFNGHWKEAVIVYLLKWHLFDIIWILFVIKKALK